MSDLFLPQEPAEEGEAVDLYAADQPLARLAAFCADQDIPLPPLPEPLLPLLRQAAPTVFTSREDLDSLADFDALVEEAATGEAPPSVGFSFEGHGDNGWFIRYVAVVPGLAILMELPFGGAYTDQTAAALQVSSAFAAAADLLRAVEPRAAEAAPLVLHHRGLRGSRWCVADGASDWQEGDAVRAVADRLSAA